MAETAQVHVCVWSAPYPAPTYGLGGDGTSSWIRRCTGDLYVPERPSCGRSQQTWSPAEREAIRREAAALPAFGGPLPEGMTRLGSIPLDRIREAAGPPPAEVADGAHCTSCDDAGFVKRAGAVVPCPDCAPPVPIAVGLPPDYLGATFASWRRDLNDTPKTRAALERCAAIAEGKATKALLVGDPGRGKSHLAAAALNASSWPKPGRWIVWGDWWQDLRGRMFGAEDEHFVETSMLRPLQTMPGLLVIDDVGAGDGGSPASRQRLYLVVEARHSLGLPIILTTNDLGRLEDRVISRLADGRAGLLHCDGAVDVRRIEVAQ